MSNSSPLIRELPLDAFPVLYEILFSLCNPIFYLIFRITETFYKWNLSVIGAKTLPLEIRIRESQLYFVDMIGILRRL